MRVTFCGHSEVLNANEVEKWLYQVVEAVIQQGADEFYLGGYGQFDLMASQVVTKIKRRYPHIKRVLVIPYLNREFDKTYYDCSYYPGLEKVPKRFAIRKRNEIMIREADVVIAFVNHSWGGAKKTLEYAEQKKKRIIKFGDDGIL